MCVSGSLAMHLIRSKILDCLLQKMMVITGLLRLIEYHTESRKILYKQMQPFHPIPHVRCK